MGAVNLVPSCGKSPAPANCTGFEDPGVLVPSATGTGAAGTASSGLNFAFTLTNSVSGEYAIAPVPAGTVYTLTPTGPTNHCTINFTTDVRKRPTIDANAVAAGLQTGQVASATVSATGGLPGGGLGGEETTVERGSIGMQAAAAPASIVLGDAFHATATITKPVVGTDPTGSVTFDGYGPGDPTCTGAPALTSTNPIDAAGTAATSADFTPPSAGTWKVIARYGADANYLPLATACEDAAAVVVARSTPAIATRASASVEVGGGTLTAGATVTGSSPRSRDRAR